MFQLVGKYERDEIWSNFEINRGATMWPSSNPNDSPIDTFICKKCGKQFAFQMYGHRFSGDSSFEEIAFVRLAEHMNIKHG